MQKQSIIQNEIDITPLENAHPSFRINLQHGKITLLIVKHKNNISDKNKKSNFNKR